MLHISICGAEEHIAVKIKGIIQTEMKRHNKQIAIDIFPTGEEFLCQYQNRVEELIFMEIDMPIKSGIDVIRTMDEMDKSENIILITNRNDIVLDLLCYAPFQIIRKANMESDITMTIQRYMKKQTKKHSFIEIKGNNAIYHIKKDNILYFEKYRHYIIVHQSNNTEIKVRGNLKEYEIGLSEAGFIRVHTGYLVNLLQCYCLEKNDIILNDGSRIPISRERKKIVKEQFILRRG